MTAQPNADLEVYQPPALAVVPAAEGNDFDSWIAVAGQVVKLAREIFDTPFVPDGLRGSAPAVAAAILAGRELGLPPITALQHTHVIKGKIGHSALLMRALIMHEGHDWIDVDVSDVRAVVKGRRKGEAEWAEASFTADQAKRAHIDLGGYPQDKLYARATVRLARRKFADVILGMPHAAEELEDGDVPDDTPAPAADGQEPPKPATRTARRKTAASETQAAARPAPGRPAAAVPDGTPASGPAAAAEPDEDQQSDGPPEDQPDSVSEDQLMSLHIILGGLGFGGDDREQKLKIAEAITGRAPLTGPRTQGRSSKNLSFTEARKLIDTLDGFGGDREKLIAFMAEREQGGGSDG